MSPKGRLSSKVHKKEAKEGEEEGRWVGWEEKGVSEAQPLPSFPSGDRACRFCDQCRSWLESKSSHPLPREAFEGLLKSRELRKEQEELFARLEADRDLDASPPPFLPPVPSPSPFLELKEIEKYTERARHEEKFTHEDPSTT